MSLSHRTLITSFGTHDSHPLRLSDARFGKIKKITSTFASCCNFSFFREAHRTIDTNQRGWVRYYFCPLLEHELSMNWCTSWVRSEYHSVCTSRTSSASPIHLWRAHWTSRSWSTLSKCNIRVALRCHLMTMCPARSENPALQTPLLPLSYLQNYPSTRSAFDTIKLLNADFSFRSNSIDIFQRSVCFLHSKATRASLAYLHFHSLCRHQHPRGAAIQHPFPVPCNSHFYLISSLFGWTAIFIHSDLVTFILSFCFHARLMCSRSSSFSGLVVTYKCPQLCVNA